jgi:hypothetical protein
MYKSTNNGTVHTYTSTHNDTKGAAGVLAQLSPASARSLRVRMRQHTAYVSTQHTSAYSIRQHTSNSSEVLTARIRLRVSTQHTSAHSIRQHTAYVSIRQKQRGAHRTHPPPRQHTSAHSIRQHTAYVSIRQKQRGAHRTHPPPPAHARSLHPLRRGGHTQAHRPWRPR